MIENAKWIRENSKQVLEFLDGGFWTIKEVRAFNFTATSSQGLKLYFSLEKNHRLKVSQSFDHKYKDAVWYQPILRVGLSLEKTPLQIAKDLNRRLIPEALKAWAVVQERQKELDASLEYFKKLTKKCYKALKYEECDERPSNLDSYGARIHFHTKDSWGELVLHSDSAYLLARSLPHNKLLRILKILGEGDSDEKKDIK